MEIINETDFEVGATQATDKGGHNFLLSVCKASYDFPINNGDPLTLSGNQLPILETDIFEGEPGITAPLFESDWAFKKNKCDIILKATAHVPNNEKKSILGVKFRVANCEKKLRILGTRTFQSGMLGGLNTSDPKLFSSMPISYSKSFGGSWLIDEDTPDFYMKNPVGCGYGRSKHTDFLIGKEAPNIGPFDLDFSTSNQKFEPQSFGPLGRSWSDRSKYAGTYDQDWMDNVFPLLPSDFDERFYQCAPPDQQIDFPNGGEVVGLWNMHPEKDQIFFRLPTDLDIPIVAISQKHKKFALQAVVDTILIDVDEEQLSLVWRTRLPIKRSLREIKTLTVGDINEEQRDKLLYGNENDCSDCGL